MRNSRCTTGDADAERRERTWTWTDGTDVGTRIVCDYGRAEAMASTTARGLARARASDGGGSMKDSGVEGATSRRRGRGGRGGGARVKGASGVFVLGAALVKGAFGTSDYTNYVRVRSDCVALDARNALADSTSRLTNHFVSEIFVHSRKNSRWRSTNKV